MSTISLITFNSSSGTFNDIQLVGAGKAQATLEYGDHTLTLTFWLVAEPGAQVSYLWTLGVVFGVLVPVGIATVGYFVWKKSKESEKTATRATANATW